MGYTYKCDDCGGKDALSAVIFEAEKLILCFNCTGHRLINLEQTFEAIDSIVNLAQDGV